MMNWIKLPLNCKAVGLSILFSGANFISSSPQIFAAQRTRTVNSNSTTVQQTLPPAPKTGTPPNTGYQGKSKGGNCPEVTTPLTALIPTYTLQNGKDYLWGQTVDERPTFWVYVPYSLNASRPGELRLQETKANGTTVFTTVVSGITTTAPGIVGVRLPANKTLKANQTYLWKFVIRCDPNNTSADQFVSTAVTRVQTSPALAKQLKNATPNQKAAIYAREGLWYDSVTAFASLRQAKPEDAKTKNNWQTVLRAARLDNFVEEKIVK
jgi:hypothetical protein